MVEFITEDLVELVWGGQVDGFEIVEEAAVYDKRRWTSRYSLVFKYEDKFYRLSYEEGNTEYQEVDIEDTLTYLEVEPYTTTVTRYRVVKNG